MFRRSLLVILAAGMLAGCGQLPTSRAVAAGSNALAARSVATKVDAQLIEAAGKGRTDEVKALLTKGANINARNGNGYTALALAAWRGHEATVTALIAAGADANLVNEDRKSPLHWAAVEGHTAIVTALLAGGGKVESRDKDGWSPLAWAAYNNRIDAAKALIAAGADVNAKITNGTSVLKLAKSGGWPIARFEIIRVLEAAGAKL